MDDESKCLENQLDTINEPCSNCPLAKALQDVYTKSLELSQYCRTFGPIGVREYNYFSDPILRTEDIIGTMTTAINVITSETRRNVVTIPSWLHRINSDLEGYVKYIANYDKFNEYLRNTDSQ